MSASLAAADGVTVFAGGSTIAGKVYQGVRIPALLRLADGTLLAFAEGRVHGLADHGDVDLILSRSNDQGATWSAPVVVADAADAFIGNAAPIVDAKTGVITVLMAWKAPGAVERDIRSGKHRYPLAFFLPPPRRFAH
jgi:sialidase-1